MTSAASRDGDHGAHGPAHAPHGRHDNYCVTDTQSDLGIRNDGADSPKSLTPPASVISAPRKWHWVRALHLRSETGKILVAFLLLGTVSLFTWIYYEDRELLNPCPDNDNVTCHFESIEDDLPPLVMEPTMDIIQLLSKAPVPWGQDRDSRNIFLVHATCERDLTPLQACAVEAAARLHPRRTVHVLFAGPVPVRRALAGVFPALALPNVRFARAAVLDYLWDTPYYNVAWALSLGKRSYVSTETLLRLSTLHKYDGAVVALGRVLRAPLDALGGDFVTTEGGAGGGLSAISPAAIGLERAFRREFCDHLAREISRMSTTACEDFTGEPALRAVVDSVLRRRTEGAPETLRVYSLSNGTHGPLFRPPTAGPTLEDCPRVFNYTTHLNKTQHQNT